MKVPNWRNVVALVHDLGAAAFAWVLAYLLRLNFELYYPYREGMWRDLVWICPFRA